jgi:hypothetical protein
MLKNVVCFYFFFLSKKQLVKYKFTLLWQLQNLK